MVMDMPKAKPKQRSSAQIEKDLANRSTDATYKSQFSAGLVSSLKDTKGLVPNTSVSGAPEGGSSKKGGQSFWHWLGDIVDRPRRAIGEAVETAAENTIDSIKDIQTGHYDAGRQLQRGLNQITAPARGFFSTAKGDQRTTSEMEEHLTDRVGKNFDKNYKDTANNVNPVLKGVTGFIGDVATDPLTYIGIGAVGRGVKMGLDAAKQGEGALKATKMVAGGVAEYTGVKALKDGVVGSAKLSAKLVQKIKGTEKVLDTVPHTAKEAAEAGRAVGESVKADVEASLGVERAGTAGVDAERAAAVPSVQKPVENVVPTPAPAAALPDADAVGAALATTPKVDPRVKAIESAPEAPFPAAGADSVAIPVDEHVQAATEAHAAASAEVARLAKEVERWDKKSDELLAKFEAAADDDGVTPRQHEAMNVAHERAYQMYSKTFDQHAAAEEALGAAQQALDAAKTAKLAEKAVPATEEAARAPLPKQDAPTEGGSGANPFEAAAKPLPPMSVGDQMREHPEYGRVSQLMDSLAKTAKKRNGTTNVTEAFVKLVQADAQQKIQAMLGPLLLQSLLSMRSDRFAASIKKIDAVLKDSGHLDTLSVADELEGPLGQLWKRMGIDAQGTNAARRSSESALRNDPEKVIGKITDTELEEVAAAKAEGGAAAAKLSQQDVQLRVGAETDAKAALEETYPAQVRTDDIGEAVGGRTTRQGAKTNAKGRGSEDSRARFTNRIGTHPQWNHFIALSKRVQARIAAADKNVGGASFAASKRKATVRGLRLMEQVLDDAGAPLHMEDAVNPPITLSFGQLLDTMIGQGERATKAVDVALFNGATAVAPTKLMEAVVAMQAGKPAEHILGILTSATKREGKNHIPNWLAGNAEKWGKVDYNRFGKMPAEAPEGYKFTPHPKGFGYYTEVSSKHLARELTEALQLSSNKLRGIAHNNATAYAERFKAEGVDLLDERKAAITALIEDPVKLSEAIMRINGRAKDIGKVANEAGARADSAAMAEARLDADLPDAAAVNAKGAEAVKAGAAAQDAERVAEAKVPVTDEAAKGAEERTKLVEDADPSLKEETIDLTEQLTSKAYRQINASKMAFLDPVTKRFNAHWALDDQLPLYQLQHEPVALSQDWWGQIKPEIRALVEKFGTPKPGSARTPLLRALEDAAQGVESGDEAAGARALLDGHLARIFNIGQDGDPVLGSVFGRLGAPLEYLNAQMSHYGALKHLTIDAELAMEKAAEQGISVYAAGIDQWRDWVTSGKITDVEGFLTSMNHLALKATTHASVVDSLGKHMRRAGLLAKAGENAAKGKLRATFGKDSPLAAFWNPDWRVDPAMAPGLQRVHEIMTEGTKLHGEHANFLEKVYDPAQRMWKFGMTLPRPGHHFRNLVGDASMTFLAEGPRYSMRATQDAFRIMAASGVKFEDMDFARALEGSGDLVPHIYEGPGQKIVKNKFGEFSAADLYKAQKDRGALPEFRNVEQFESGDTAGAFEKLSNKLTTENKFGRFVGKMSEGRDHWSRSQHFVQVLHKFEKDGYVLSNWGKKVYPKSANELFDAAVARVKQYHPDGTNLTRFEKNVLRRVIPFYSWMRGAIPAVIEAGIRNPGRVTALNKVSYNLAVANGVNPDSLYDPFPTDQLFPSFLAQQVQGPQLKVNGHYWSISPGLATWDLANTFGDPKAGLLGSIAPAVRVPFEALTGTSLATGAKIKDTSDYVDQQIPLVSNLSNLTGTSVTGSVAGVASGNGLDQQRQVRAGNKGGEQQVAALISFLTGVQATDQSRKDYKNFAKFEQQPKKLERGQATGF